MYVLLIKKIKNDWKTTPLSISCFQDYPLKAQGLNTQITSQVQRVIMGEPGKEWKAKVQRVQRMQRASRAQRMQTNFRCALQIKTK